MTVARFLLARSTSPSTIGLMCIITLGLIGEIWLYWSREMFMTSFAIVKKSIVRCTSIHQRALQGHTIIIIIKEKGGRPMKIPTCLIGDCHCSDRADREVSSSRQLLLRHSSLLRENTFHNIDTLFQIFKIWGFCLLLAENDPESGYLIFVTGATGGARVNFFGQCKFLQI